MARTTKIAVNLLATVVVIVLLFLLVGNGISWIYFEEKNSQERTISLFLTKQAEVIAEAHKIDPKISSSPEYLDQFKDYWNKTLKVEFQAHSVMVTSAGPDGIFGTSDDIQVEERMTI